MIISVLKEKENSGTHTTNDIEENSIILMIWLNYHWKSLIVIEKEISTNKWSNICFHRQMLLFNRANTMQMVLLFFSLGRFLSWSRFIIGTCRLSTLSTTVVVVVFLSRQLNLSSSLLDVYSTTSIKSTWDTLLNCIDRQNTDLITPPEHFSTHVRHITLSLSLERTRCILPLEEKNKSQLHLFVRRKLSVK